MEDYRDAEARNNNKTPHPYKEASFLSKVFFVWLLPLFKKGYSTDLTEKDLSPILKSHNSTFLGKKLKVEWAKEVRKATPSLWRALAKVFWKEAVVLGVWYLLVETCIKLSQPLALKKLLEYFEANSAMSKNEAYIYASLVILTTLVPPVFQHNFMFRQFLLGRKVKVATSALVYEKALKLSKSAFADTTVGQMVNLISNDVGRFEQATRFLQDLWVLPIELTVVLCLLYFNVGVTGMVGLIFVVGYIPFQMWLGRKTSIYRLRTALKTDERIRLMNEIVTGIQVIKMYTWEKPFAKLVEISRRKEIQQIKKTSIIRGINMSFTLFLTRTSIYICILTYYLTGNALTAQYVYVITSFYHILQKTLTIGFPQGAMQMAESCISVKRIKQFLLFQEVESLNVQKLATNDFQKEKFSANGVIPQKSVGIHLKNVAIKWVSSSNEYNLEHVNLVVNSHELGVVIGPVGSGKTTLLHAILRELPASSGTVEIHGKVSYASQEPWLFVGSVRQNITFGDEFDAKRYQEVVRVCALERDFRLFPYGDRTLVGERGVSLSGGQRARINLARAVYKKADIYLLDDPLSAVDTHVGKHIFEECITGYLKDKCVVLVTHQLQYLKDVNKIYLLGGGTVEKSGSYQQIQESTEGFAKLLNELNKDEESEGSETENQEILDNNDSKPRRRSTKKRSISKTTKDPIIAKESKGEGKISVKVYQSYFYAGGNTFRIFLFFALFIIAQIFCSFTDYYLSYWVNMEQMKRENGVAIMKTENSLNETAIDNIVPYDDLIFVNDTFTRPVRSNTALQTFWMTYMSEDVILTTYSCLIAFMIVATLTRSLFFYNFCMRASTQLHKNMFDKIVYATMRFFNTNPSGRILNRFAMDMNQVDELLPLSMLDALQNAHLVVAITAVVASVNPWMLLPTVIILSIFYFLRVVYLATSRDIKRLEGITRSPVYSHLTATLQGVTTIRAFGAEEILTKEFDNYQNENSSAYFTFTALGRSFGMTLDMHCVVFVALVTLSFLFFDAKTLGGNVGLAITQSITLTGMFQWGMRQWSELENTMTCVERIKEYADIEPEKDVETKEPPKNWPEEGNVTFENLSLRYAADEPNVLKNLSLNIRCREKVGIVGRTGAGKSSIIAALFRLAENEGTIVIDNVDTKYVPLHRLRSSISIIPQEPVLFSGTMRKNLDPFDEYSDELKFHFEDIVECIRRSGT
ncbi:ATP-binding cassette subfamily C member 4-like isoform X2 [Cylas formicarius]|uniref:ATP-binding cassette subfamily C member 4-like isoform X2 n=1 Tax=Cylas formicarius TaxID=197179 RepID=UPI0029585451|nr:ATP-binding cassette subfamily C member 4-like isoform X2 [Cylas formicarius]